MTKQIVITGGSGFIGSQLLHLWLSQGHKVYALTRRPVQLQQRWVDYADQLYTFQSFDELGLESVDWVVHLAGEGIADRLWTKHRKSLLAASRIGVTNKLARWLDERNINAEVVISGSAIGIYGAGDDWVDEETTTFANDFAAELCQKWEQSALALQKHCKRLVIVRTGIVLGNSGGLLKRLRLPFLIGLGGRLGKGLQITSWIHIEDYCRAIEHLLNQSESQGIYNLVNENPVNNRDFTRELAAALNRPAFMHVPAIALRLLLGELSQLLLSGQKVKPKRLLAEGFNFVFPDISDALKNITK